jgi:hypothetical protein
MLTPKEIYRMKVLSGEIPANMSVAILNRTTISVETTISERRSSHRMVPNIRQWGVKYVG